MVGDCRVDFCKKSQPRDGEGMTANQDISKRVTESRRGDDCRVDYREKSQPRRQMVGDCKEDFSKKSQPEAGEGMTVKRDVANRVT